MGTTNGDASLDQMLAVGRAVLMETSVSAAAESRFTAHVRGWLCGEYVIMESPNLDSQMIIVSPKQECIFRFMAEGEVCAFRGIVLDRGTGPYSRMFRISWPRRIKTIRLRSHERVSTHVSCSILCDGEPEFSGELIDLSINGCGVLAPKPLQPGDRLELAFDLPGGVSIEAVSAIVRRSELEGDQFRLGCSFEHVPPEVQADVEYYVAITMENMREQNDENPKPWVLVIEPDPQRANPLRKVLSERGIGVFTARNAVYGMARLGNTMPMAILVDQSQGGCSGIDVCRVIRTAPKLGELPVFLYSIDEPMSDATKQEAAQAGATNCFPSLDIPDTVLDAISDLFA